MISWFNLCRICRRRLQGCLDLVLEEQERFEVNLGVEHDYPELDLCLARLLPLNPIQE